MFWSTDDGLYSVDQLTKNAQVHIDTALKRNTTKEDLELLQEAFEHMYVYFWRQYLEADESSVQKARSGGSFVESNARPPRHSLSRIWYRT
jgi:hypothetical protein